MMPAQSFFSTISFDGRTPFAPTAANQKLAFCEGSNSLICGRSAPLRMVSRKRSRFAITIFQIPQSSLFQFGKND